jgi:RND family efflux transporter, MFP subunit
MIVALTTRRRSTFKVLRYVATGVLVVAALVAARHGWRIYMTSPWTRNGMVRVQVANVAPQISGQIVDVRTYDNQHVYKGDVLYIVEKFDFAVALDNAKATILNREADLAVKKAQNARRAALTTLSTSIEEKQQFDGNAKMAEAALASAKAGLSQAEINLQRTEIRSPVDGYVTNLLMRVGDFARAGTPNLSVIDEHSYWIDAYFEETKLANIHVGDPVEATLLGFQAPINGRDREHHGRISRERGKQHAGPSKRRPDLHLGSACATNSGAYQDRTSPSGSIAGCRNDLQRSVVGGKGMPVSGRDGGSSIGCKACFRKIQWAHQGILIWEASWWLPLCDICSSHW